MGIADGQAKVQQPHSTQSNIEYSSISSYILALASLANLEGLRK